MNRLLKPAARFSLAGLGAMSAIAQPTNDFFTHATALAGIPSGGDGPRP